MSAAPQCETQPLLCLLLDTLVFTDALPFWKTPYDGFSCIDQA